MTKTDILKENGTYNPRHGKVTAACFQTGVFFDSKDLVQVKYELLRSIASGECLVCRFRGPGVVLIQTRNPGSFAGWIRSMVPSGS